MTLVLWGWFEPVAVVDRVMAAQESRVLKKEGVVRSISTFRVRLRLKILGNCGRDKFPIRHGREAVGGFRSRLIYDEAERLIYRWQAPSS
jgi:hypothetical protein